MLPMKKTPQPALKRQNILAQFIKKNFPSGLTAEELLKAATPKSSPIHEFFDWDDTRAAHKFRIEQARHYILELRVEFNEVYTKAYHNVYVEELDQRRYTPTKDVAKRSDLMDQVIEVALRNLTYWRDRYGEYKQFRDVTRAINKTERQYHGKG